ncbi:MAG: hypothetical protein LBJ62_02580 [Bifidobacteriaceae bacterium]|jgi:plasmid stability protein|nr:hypothetical protein [Bifidobacteriaceae bacterium]
MARVITIRNLDDNTQRVLRHRAVDHGVSFEAELRSVLERAAQEPTPAEPEGLAILLAAAARFREATGGLGFQVERAFEYPGDSPFGGTTAQ